MVFAGRSQFVSEALRAFHTVEMCLMTCRTTRMAMVAMINKTLLSLCALLHDMDACEAQ